MIYKKIILFSLICLATASLGLVSYGSVHALNFADDVDVACSTAPDNPYCQTKKNPPSDNTISKIIGNITTIAATIGGIGAVLMVVYGGFRYIISYGDPQKTTDARKTIIYALVGLAVIVVAGSAIIFVTHLLQ